MRTEDINPDTTRRSLATIALIRHILTYVYSLGMYIQYTTRVESKPRLQHANLHLPPPPPPGAWQSPQRMRPRRGARHVRRQHLHLLQALRRPRRLTRNPGMQRELCRQARGLRVERHRGRIRPAVVSRLAHRCPAGFDYLFDDDNFQGAFSEYSAGVHPASIDSSRRRGAGAARGSSRAPRETVGR